MRRARASRLRCTTASSRTSSALAVRLQLARALIGSDPDAASELLAELRADANAAHSRVRALSDRIFPSLLLARGLPDTLRAEGRATGRSVTVDVVGVGRYPSEVEAAVYFCCREAVDAVPSDGQLAISVRDDKGALQFEIAGPPVAYEVLARIRDRVEARGGELTVRKPAPGSADASRFTSRCPRGRG